MNKHDAEQLLRWLDGAMTPEEAAAWERRMAASPGLRARAEEMRQLRQTLQASVGAGAAQVLKPFFTDRLMRRLQPVASRSREEAFAAALATLFRPVLVASLALIMVLAAYNLTFRADDAEQPAAEAVLGLPPVTLTAAYELDL
ncbi:hypothetical protein GQ464_016835 [Rhodocaloribacter litoris]|uniref:anti-sigma factor family protein n=1 Tax=Rhodocaloribacter litoris TaxID=2558931 RepID=UPI001422F7DE|nr:hypothetical protein [Rhodocaloribacter litoris]QXD15051.1 hypothetical protein GQ464_016835 [Rhodocaloribacter litoris]GIV62154.1 MAG: hypothetical protein KatS3mg044_1020 [Rhodothermaceae bacterium]